MEKVLSIFNEINSVVWSFPTVLLLFLAGVFFTCQLNFFQFSHLRLWFSKTVLSLFSARKKSGGDENSLTAFQAVSTALAATIGTGNIAGVATAVSAGGAGAVFWMWISAVFGMMTSYSENLLGIYFRRKDESGNILGGPMYYILDGLKGKKRLSFFAKPLAVLYAVFLVLASFGIGNMTQVNAISDSLHTAFGVPTVASAVVVSALTLIVICGGMKRIGKVTERLVPLMALFYITASVCVLVFNWKNLPSAFISIFENAFSFRAAAGAAGGIAVKKCISIGFRRGIFSNEAGLGACVTVNSCSQIKEPCEQGMWGIFQVFADTLVVCTLTALVLLSSGLDISEGGEQGVSLVALAFSKCFGQIAGILICVAVVLFAFSTIIGWSFYGSRAVVYLWGEKAEKYYRALFAVFAFVGCIARLDLVWTLSDIFNGLMIFPNLIGLFSLKRIVVDVTKNYLHRRKGERISPLVSYSQAGYEYNRLDENGTV